MPVTAGPDMVQVLHWLLQSMVTGMMRNLFETLFAFSAPLRSGIDTRRSELIMDDGTLCMHRQLIGKERALFLQLILQSCSLNEQIEPETRQVLLDGLMQRHLLEGTSP